MTSGLPLRNADALELQAAASVPMPYETVNPYCFEPAIAPHLAAREASVDLALPELVAWYAAGVGRGGLGVVEGAGGWRVPLNPTGFLSDLPEALGLDVRAGRGAHARLPQPRATHRRGDRQGGRCTPGRLGRQHRRPGFERVDDNVATLCELLGSEPLARVPDLRSAPKSPFGHPLHEFTADARLLAALGLADRGG